MKIQLVTPTFPPYTCGIGDYSAHLATMLAKTVDVMVLTAQGYQHVPLPGVRIEAAFSLAQRRSIWHIAQYVEVERPDWLLLQYDPCSYDPQGLNLHLPAAIRHIKRHYPDTRIAVMVHEPNKPIRNWRNLISSTWIHWSFWMLGHNADLMIFSTEPWVRKYQKWFRHTPITHLPVGSNIPLIDISKAEARGRLGIRPGTIAMGLFGRLNASLRMDMVANAVQAAKRNGCDILVLYLGIHGHDLHKILGPVPYIAGGPLPADEISRRLTALDICLTPFLDGVSTRRTSLMSALQHGLAVVGTDGHNTDQMLRKESGRSLLLANLKRPQEFNDHTLCLLTDAALRHKLGQAARQLYQKEFAWEQIASRLLAVLSAS
jgi:glycosyltransferase involved in cell wall biosynthesis